MLLLTTDFTLLLCYCVLLIFTDHLPHRVVFGKKKKITQYNSLYINYKTQWTDMKLSISLYVFILLKKEVVYLFFKSNFFLSFYKTIKLS